MMNFKLPKLPFDRSQVASWLSTETLDYHYGKHHKSYVEKLNSLLPGSGLENESLEDIVRRSSGNLFNAAGQAWNHTFYWLGLGASYGKSAADVHLTKSANLNTSIQSSFGSVELLLTEFEKACNSLFGSGWVWLVFNEESRKIEIVSTSNAGNPLKNGMRPLLTCDVWEHAYYIDHRNDRSKYVDAFIGSINWGFVSSNFDRQEVCNLTRLMTVSEKVERESPLDYTYSP